MSNLQLQIMKSITAGHTAVQPAAQALYRLCHRRHLLLCFLEVISVITAWRVSPLTDTAVGAIKAGNVQHPCAVLNL